MTQISRHLPWSQDEGLVHSYYTYVSLTQFHSMGLTYNGNNPGDKGNKVKAIFRSLSSLHQLLAVHELNHFTCDSVASVERLFKGMSQDKFRNVLIKKFHVRTVQECN